MKHPIIHCHYCLYTAKYHAGKGLRLRYKCLANDCQKTFTVNQSDLTFDLKVLKNNGFLEKRIKELSDEMQDLRNEAKLLKLKFKNLSKMKRRFIRVKENLEKQSL